MSVLCEFDDQLRKYVQQLRDIGFSEPQQRSPCSCIFHEVRKFDKQTQDRLIKSSPLPIKTRLNALEYLITYNGMIGDQIKIPWHAWAHTVVSSYMSFVYFGDHTFRILAENNNNELTSNKIGSFLRSDVLRGFRHAIAHGHWATNDSGTGIDYWPDAKSQPFYVDKSTLIFWYIAARSTAYAALHAVHVELTNLS